MKPLESIKSVLKWGPSATKKLERIEAREARLPVLDTELRAAKDLPVPQAEHAQRTIEWFRRKRAAYLAGPTGPYDTAPSAADLVRSLALWDTPKDPDMDPKDILPFLCWVLGPQLEAGVSQAFSMLPEPESVGLPAADRPKLIDALERERAELIRDHEQLVDQVRAESNGTVTVAYLPEVAKRKQDEEHAKRVAAQRAIDEKWLAEQKRLGNLGSPHVHVAGRGPIRSEFVARSRDAADTR
jgi:hypothetical protein